MMIPLVVAFSIPWWGFDAEARMVARPTLRRALEAKIQDVEQINRGLEQHLRDIEQELRNARAAERAASLMGKPYDPRKAADRQTELLRMMGQKHRDIT